MAYTVVSNIRMKDGRRLVITVDTDDPGEMVSLMGQAANQHKAAVIFAYRTAAAVKWSGYIAQVDTRGGKPFAVRFTPKQELQDRRAIYELMRD